MALYVRHLKVCLDQYISLYSPYLLHLDRSLITYMACCRVSYIHRYCDTIIIIINYFVLALLFYMVLRLKLKYMVYNINIHKQPDS